MNSTHLFTLIARSLHMDPLAVKYCGKDGRTAKLSSLRSALENVAATRIQKSEQSLADKAVPCVADTCPR